MPNQSITTHYVGATNTLPGRVKATARKASRSGPAITHTESGTHYNHNEEWHCAAAKALAERLQWSGLWVAGGSVAETGYNYVNIPITPQRITGCTGREHPLGIEGRDWFYVEQA